MKKGSLIFIIILLFLVSLLATKNYLKPKPLSLADYPNNFITNNKLTARLVVPSSANGIVLGGNFAIAVQILRYENNLSYNTPLLMTSNETYGEDDESKIINKGDLIIVGNPCKLEPELLSERYPCSLWKEKPQYFEFFLEKKDDSKKLYAVLKDEVERDKAWGFVSNYISFKEKFPTKEPRICFSADQQ